jgi:ABC-type lipoprotein export system ATPase subunit
MFEKYNEKARRALFFARYEASKLGGRIIESEHILLGNLDAESGERVLDRLFDLQARHGTTALLVTHNPEIAGRCGRVLELRVGELRKVLR